MSYRDSIIKKHYAAAADFMSDLWSELNSMGWTLEDDQSGSNYKVYSSTGEDGLHLKGYLYISWTTTAVTIYAYTWWDSTNHAGYGGSSCSETVAINDSDFYGWIYGSKDFFYLMSLRGTTYDHVFAGYLEPFLATPRATIQANATAGDSVTIEVDDTTGFVAGTTYQIVDAGNGYRMQAIVGSITDSTHMVLNHLSYDITIGAIIAPNPILFGVGKNSSLYLTCPWQTQGSGNSASSYLLDLTYPLLGVIYVDPEKRINRYVLQSIKGPEQDGENTAVGGYSTNCYFCVAPIGTAEDIFYIGEQDNGTSSGSNDTNHLNDTAKAWTASAFKDKVLIITAGPGVSEIHKISDNTATQITIVDTFKTVPDDTSNYIIVDEAYRHLAYTNAPHIVAREGV